MRTGVSAATVLILSGLVFPVSPAAAVESCREIEDDTRRLVCYDSGNGNAPKKPAQVQHPPVAARVFSREVVNCGRSFDSRIIMAMGCRKNATKLDFGTLCHASASGGKYRKVTMRLDGSSETRVPGRAARDRGSHAVWASSNAKQLLKRMIGSSKLIVRLTPASGDAFTGTFNISNLSETIKPLRRACGW